MLSIFLVTASYLVGAVPFGLLVGKIAGVDVRNAGSKNIGATNVNRLLGKKFGSITLLCDCLKGYLPMLVASWAVGDSAGGSVVVLGCGVSAVVGHMFPIYLGFDGGKGVATGLGVFLFLSPSAILISLVVFVVTVAISGFVSAGSLLASGLIPLWLFFLDATPATVTTAAIVAGLIWVKHHENIGRLLKGQEKSWKTKK
ncbi:glycerol-3-phosphate 1-O-acyltransferase PlsY [Desulfopila sp. IMCC35008]|uniref:glycerol-3-phosphate 1-O-acyltransferase PlsY n=1 Tax=Desulfopila sp. IMCC35008 TaxID=2653858 RepID=UPI00197A853F|nr:glycerol-3-phosphate 1-O-acyltransferase PlsY [Desulfopila sp. IMCC35008]